LVGDRQARVVGDVLAQGQLAVDVVARQRLEGVVLLDQHRGLGLEVLVVGLGPPVAQVAVAVVLGALVVEAVADLVADHGADAAVVDRVVRVGVEERRLQDRGREHDLVHLRVVVGVDGLRRHAPLVAVDRLAQLVDFAVGFDHARTHHVADQVVTLHHQLRVILPLVRVADLRRELGQLGLRFLLGGRAHPVELVDRLLVGGQQVLHQRFHARLALGREVLGHVQLAQRLALRTLDRAHATLPARFLLLHAGQGLAVEVEALVDEVLRQVAAVGSIRCSDR
jgi:hypothetical protein